MNEFDERVFFTSDKANAAALLADAPSPIVVVPVYNSYADTIQCLEAVARNTPPELAVLVVDDAGPDRRFFEALERVRGVLVHRTVVFQHEHNTGFVGACNDGFEISAGRDVVLLNSDVLVGPEWLTRLAAAAYSSSVVATASAITNHGTILSTPERNRPTSKLPGNLSPDEAARRVAAASRRLYPTIPTALGHCVYIKRQALDLVGVFDEAFAPGYGEEVDFSQRALAMGMRHVAADDVFTYHRGSGSYSKRAKALQDEHHRLILARYPYYDEWVRRASHDPYGPLAAALTTAKAALVGLRLAVDGMCLGDLQMGTQRVVVETVRALAECPQVAEIVVHSPIPLPEYAAAAFEGSTTIRVEELPKLEPGDRSFDAVYRPYQLVQPEDLEWLRTLSPTVVVNQLDLIAYHDPAYFADDGEWNDYRNLTHLMAATCDGLAFISQNGRDEARAEGLIPPGAPTQVVYCGIDHAEPDDESQRAPASDLRPGFVLCLGASYLHKNRLFALRVWQAMRSRGFEGQLVLAGPQPPYGSSVADEAAQLLADPAGAAQVVRLPGVSESEKWWLYRNAALVLYPTVVEGFGLVPFEAAQVGAPTLATRQGSLDEVLPTGIPTIDSFDAGRAADQAMALLADPAAVDALCLALVKQSGQFTWRRTAEAVVTLLEEAIAQPASRVLAVQTPAGPVAVKDAHQTLGLNLSVARQLVETAFVRVQSNDVLREFLSPDGSTRQRKARELINHLRRRF